MWRGALRVLVWGWGREESRQGRGGPWVFPSIGFSCLGVGGRRWWEDQGAESRGRGRTDLFIAGVGEARAAGLGGTSGLGGAFTAVYKDLARFLPDLHLLSSAPSSTLSRPRWRPECPWDP